MSERAKDLFFKFALVGYVIGVVVGIPIVTGRTVTHRYCSDVVGPDDICMHYYSVREKEYASVAFYTYGLIGAFLGGWAYVIYTTYIRKE